MKKYLSFLPMIALMACTDYQADWENTFGPYDQMWQAQEALLSSSSMTIPLSSSEFIPLSSETVPSEPTCTEGLVVNNEVQGCIVSFICSDNIWVEFDRKCTSQISSSSAAPSKPSSSSATPIKSSSSSATPVKPSSSSTAVVTARKILDYDFNRVESTSGWTLTAYDETRGSVSLVKNNDSAYVLQFYPMDIMEEEWWLQATYPVNLQYGRAYRIHVSAYPYGKGDSFYIGIQNQKYETITGDNVNLDTSLDVYSQWLSARLSFCGSSTDKHNLVINGGKGNMNGFAIQWVTIEETGGTCP